MKKILTILIFLSVLIASGTSASEILGNISTNPRAPAGEENKPPAEEPAEQPSTNEQTTSTVPLAPVPVAGSGGGAVILSAPAQQLGLSPAGAGGAQAGGRELNLPPVNQPAGQAVPAPRSRILGAKVYADNTLARGPDQRIYLIKGQAKKYVTNLAELEKYRGRAIATVSAAILASYPDYKPTVGELVRQKGDARVYAVEKGRKYHVLNLEELRTRYFGLEIFNLSPEQMALYP